MSRNESIVNPYAKKRPRTDDSSHLLEQSTRGVQVDSSAQNYVPPSVSTSNSGDDKTRATAQAAEESLSPTAERASALVIAASDKAGMEGIDCRRIDEIIMRASGNSLFMQQQRKRDEKVNAKIADLKEHLKRTSIQDPSWRERLENEIDREVPAILSQRPTRSTCVVVDMDMFFMACELLGRPELAHRPACVGGNMISTSNYVARKYGVRSAMAGYIGDRLVHELSNGRETLTHVPHNFELYKQKSDVVRGVLAEYDPALSAYSLDEVYLNLNSYLAIKLQHQDWDHERIKSTLHSKVTGGDDAETHGSIDSADSLLCDLPEAVCMAAVEEIVKEMRGRVFRETGGLTCSAGVAPNFMLAKIASDRNKPNGQLVVSSDHSSIVEFLYPLSTRKVSGIGRVQEKILNAFSIHRVRDLYEERALVRLLFSPITAAFLLRASLGCSSSGASSSSSSSSEDSAGQKGISRERTFQPIHCWSEINARLEDIGKLLSDDMKRKDLWSQTVTVKVKMINYDVLSKCRTLPKGSLVQASADIVDIAASLISGIRHEHKGGPFSIRLLGIRCSNFGSMDSDQNDSSIEIAAPVHSPKRAWAPPVTLDRYLKKKGQVNVSYPKEAQTDQPSAVAGAGHAGIKSDDTGMDGNAVAAQVKDSSAHVLGAEAVVSCPLCGAAFSIESNRALNQHIDTCLNEAAFRQELQGRGLSKCNAKKRRISDFFSKCR